MSEQARVESGKKFARDLRRIREERGLSKQDLHEETKIPQSLIDSFETTGLFEHPMFNRVYLRSFVRTYADFLSISEDPVLDALEEALAGNYQGALARRYFSEDESLAGSSASDSPARAEEQPAEAEPGDEDFSRGAASTSKKGENGSEEGATEEAEKPQPSTPASPSAPTETPAGERWMEQSPPRSDREKGKQTASRRLSALPPYALFGGAVALIVLVTLAYFLFRPAETPDQTVVPVETDTSAVETVQENEPAGPALSLGETIDFTVLAAGGPVQAIRITRDGDLRRPFWIEEGGATVFPARERIVLEEQLENIRLLLEGYEYPTDRRDNQGRIVITREAAQAFADTVRGEPVSLAIEPDTNRVPAP